MSLRLYNKAGVLGGSLFGSVGKSLLPLARNMIPVYGLAYDIARLTKGGWDIAADAAILTKEGVNSPQDRDFIEKGKALFNSRVIPDAEQNAMMELVQKHGLELPKDLDFIQWLIGVYWVYDTLRCLTIPQIAQRYNIRKQDVMLARQRAALCAIVINTRVPTLGEKYKDFAHDVWALLHKKRGTVRAERILALADPTTPYANIDESLLPVISTEGYGPKDSRIPWKRDWASISPELAARAVNLLNKTTKSGITLDPDTIAAAAKGEVPESAKKEMKIDKEVLKEAKKIVRKEMEKAAQEQTKKKAGKPKRKSTPKYDDDDIVYPKFDDDDDDDDGMTETKRKKKTPKKSKRKGVPPKGSAEAKRRMAKVRAARGKKNKRKKTGGSAIWDSYFKRNYGYDDADLYTPGLIWSRVSDAEEK